MNCANNTNLYNRVLCLSSFVNIYSWEFVDRSFRVYRNFIDKTIFIVSDYMYIVTYTYNYFIYNYLYSNILIVKFSLSTKWEVHEKSIQFRR